MLALPFLLLLTNFHVDYATYLGGSLDEQTAGIAVDSGGNVYVTGITDSPDFPLTSTAFGTPSPGHACAFVTKLVKGFALGIPGSGRRGVHRINFQMMSLEDSDERLLRTPPK